MQKWRKSTWVLAVWLVVGVLAFGTPLLASCEGLNGEAAGWCTDSEGYWYILIFWFVAGVFLGLFWFGTRPTTAGDTAPSGSVCGRCAMPLSPYWRGKCGHCGASYAQFPPVT
jgi:hypothetical protein